MSDEIAIVGVGCRFPGADNLEEFWRVLHNGENHVREVDNERWDFYRYYDPDINAEGKSYVNKAGLLKDIDKWDNQLFGVSDNEAKVVDPQQRLVLDCCHMAMEDAGITRKRLDGSQTSVYIGAMNDDFKARKHNFTAEDSAYSVTGIFRSILSARVSYTFNLKGPCMVVDTACSSSLAAIHLACQSLRLKESGLSFAGGVSILLDPSPFVALSKAHMLSPTGQCQTFTSDADGYARGEGCGMVILQRVEDAIREGNNIWGVIKTGTNQDGRMVTPMTAPSGFQQLELLNNIYSDREADKNNVQFIEAHGTGTPIGDPTEVNALGEFFKDSETAKRNRILIGSVKTNIGHLESAAGVAGLIKVMLMMRQGKIVPSVMYSEEKRNPKIDFNKFNLTVPTDVVNWDLNHYKTRIACVNSFGYGGSNAHLLIKQWLPRTNVIVANGQLENQDHNIFALSSLDQSGLVKNLQQFKDDLERSLSTLSSIANTSLCRRDHFKYRVALISSSKEELKNQCLGAIKRIEHMKVPGSVRFVYIFCGVGTTWKGMCYELLQNKTFLAAVLSIDYRLKKYTGWSVTDKWKNKEDMSDPFVSHIALFVCQIGLTAVWKALSIEPDAVVGQSVGEVAACYAAGIIDEESAARIIYHRSLLLSQCKSGGMLVVRNINVTTVETICKKIGHVNIAVYLSPIACTVAGEKAAITRIKSVLLDMPNVFLKDLDVSCGYHSPTVESAGNCLQTSLTGLIKGKKENSRVRMISTVYGKEINQSEYCEASYWKNNVICPVQFHNAISQALFKREYTVFIEIGPSSVLKAHSADMFGELSNCLVVPSVVKGKEHLTLLQAFAAVYELGSEIDLGCFLKEDACKFRPTLLPRYVFNKKSFPLPKEYKTKEKFNQMKKCQNKVKHGYIYIKGNSNSEDFMEIRISPETTPYVYQHFVRETIIVPGALYTDVGFEIGTHLLQVQADDLNVTLDFLKAVPLNENESLLMNVRVKEEIFVNVKHFSFLIENNGDVVCKGIVKGKDNVAKNTYASLESLYLDMHQRVSSNGSYEILQAAGFKYGPQLSVIREGVKNNNMSLINISITDEVIGDLLNCHIHPCILDGMLQTTVIFSNEGRHSKESSTIQFLPVGMDSLVVTKTLKSINQNTKLKVLTEKLCYASLETMKKLHYNIYLLDGYGFILAEIKNFTLYAANRHFKSCDDLRYSLTWRTVEYETEHSNSNVFEGKLVVINANYIVCSYFKNSEYTVEYCNFEGFFDENGNNIDEKMTGCSKIVVFFISDTKYVNNGQHIFDTVSKNFKLLQGLVLHIKKPREGISHNLSYHTRRTF